MSWPGWGCHLPSCPLKSLLVNILDHVTSHELILASFADVQVELDDGSKSAIKQLGQIATPQPDKIFINLSSHTEVRPLTQCLLH